MVYKGGWKFDTAYLWEFNKSMDFFHSNYKVRLYHIAICKIVAFFLFDKFAGGSKFQKIADLNLKVEEPLVGKRRFLFFWGANMTSFNEQ